MLILALTTLVLLGDPDGVIATARSSDAPLPEATRPVAPQLSGVTSESAAHGLSTAEQIEGWLAARSVPIEPFSEGDEAGADDRRMHGYIDAGVGTGGYRDIGAGVSLPLGRDGRLDLQFRHVENDPYAVYDRNWSRHPRSNSYDLFSTTPERPPISATD